MALMAWSWIGQHSIACTMPAGTPWSATRPGASGMASRSAISFSRSGRSLARTLVLRHATRQCGCTSRTCAGSAATRCCDPNESYGKGGQFETVAHLWAAHRLLYRSTEYGEGADLDWPLLLAIAENFRNWAEGYHSPTGRTGTGQLDAALVAASSGWRPPDEAVLPYSRAFALDRLRLGSRAMRLIATTAVLSSADQPKPSNKTQPIGESYRHRASGWLHLTYLPRPIHNRPAGRRGKVKDHICQTKPLPW